MQPIEGRLPTRLAFFHGLGSIAYGVKDNGFLTFLMLYYNQVLGMDAQLVSLALMLALVIDGFVDPIIGYLSDRTYSPWGRRLPWLYFAAVPLGIAWYFLWAVNEAPSFWGLVGLAVLIRILVSACEVPSIALVPELTRDYDERTRLMRFRFLFGWAGGLFVMMLAYNVFLADGLLQADGYRAYGITGALMITAGVLISAAAQHRYAAGYPARARSKFSLLTAFSELRESFSHRAFLILLAGGALAYTSQGITFTISNYLYLFVWEFSREALKFYPWILFLSVVVTFTVLPHLHARWGKRDTAKVTALIGAAFWATPFLLRPFGLWLEVGSTASTVALFALFFLSNVFSVSAMISASSMVADVVEASEEQTGRRSEGAFFAGNMFMAKCATGLGIFVTGQMLAFSGLQGKADPGQVPATVIDTLSLTYALTVAVFAVGVFLVIRRFPITRADHEARLEKLGAARTNPDAEGMHP